MVSQDALKLSWRLLEDVLQDVFKMSWKTKNCYAEDVLKTSSRHVLKTSRRRLEDQQMFAGLLYIFKSYKSIFQKNLKVLSRNYVLFLILRPTSRLVEFLVNFANSPLFPVFTTWTTHCRLCFSFLLFDFLLFFFTGISSQADIFL